MIALASTEAYRGHREIVLQHLKALNGVLILIGGVNELDGVKMEMPLFLVTK